MKVRDLLREAGRVPLSNQNTDGLTFGFEAEIVVPMEWYARNAEFSDELSGLDPESFETIFEFDDGIYQEQFHVWKEDNDKEDADENDWFNDVGVEGVIEAISAKPQAGYIVQDGFVYHGNQSRQEVFYILSEKLYELVGGDIRINANDEKNENKDYSNWYIEHDASVNGKSYWDMPCEIVSPVFEYFDQFIEQIQTVLTWLQSDEYGDAVCYTNNTCGFHVNIGVPAGMKPDFLKMAIFMGADHLHKMFGGNRGGIISSYADFIRDHLKAAETTPESFDELVTFLNEKLKSVDSKEYIVNHFPYLEGKNYIEFRAIGGRDYEKKIDLIIKNINRFVFLMRLACDPNMYRREYMQKIASLISHDHKSPVSGDMVVRKFKTWLTRNGYSNIIDTFLKDDVVQQNYYSRQVLLEAILRTHMNQKLDQNILPILRTIIRRQGTTLEDIEEWKTKSERYDSDGSLKDDIEYVLKFATSSVG